MGRGRRAAAGAGGAGGERADDRKPAPPVPARARRDMARGARRATAQVGGGGEGALRLAARAESRAFRRSQQPPAVDGRIARPGGVTGTASGFPDSASLLAAGAGNFLAVKKQAAFQKQLTKAFGKERAALIRARSEHVAEVYFSDV